MRRDLIETEQGWARFLPESTKWFKQGQVYPCLIQLPERNLLYPLIGEEEIFKYGSFANGVTFQILDTFLVNVDRILE